MTIPRAGFAPRPVPPPGPEDEPTSDVETAAWARGLARAILAHALLLGIAADALLRDGPRGVAFPLWIAIGVLAAVSLAWRGERPLTREVRGWLLTALVFSLGLAWRDAGMLQLLDLAATVGALTMAAIALRNGRSALFAERLRDTVWSAGAVARSAAVGMLQLVLRDLGGPHLGARAAPRAWRALRAALIAAVVLVVFGSLLRDADPIFASLVAIPDVDVGLAVSHLAVIGLVAWIVGGWAREAVLAGPRGRSAPDALPFRLGKLDVTAALTTLTVLFALFVLSQLGWFFGGEAFLRERTGLTAASYARQGFFQMVWVVTLVVPLLVLTRATLEPDRALARRHTALALPVVGLLFAIIVSAFLRMRLYVQYYGLTTDRFYPLVFMAWLALVLGWLALTVLRDRGRPFVGGTVIAGAVLLALLNGLAPDALVARVDIARAAKLPPTGGAALDLPYLASLSGEAAELAVEATLAPARAGVGTTARDEEERRRCAAARTLLSRWTPDSRRRDPGPATATWRRWNAGAQRAQRVVREHAAALRGVTHTACRYRLGR